VQHRNRCAAVLSGSPSGIVKGAYGANRS